MNIILDENSEKRADYPDYSDKSKMENVSLIIDNGSYKCRAGWSSSELPNLDFRNIIAKPRKDRSKKGAAAVEANVKEDAGMETQIGNIDAVRMQLKTQFDRNIVTHFYNQEKVFDFIFSRLNIDNDGFVPHPVLLTEPLGNPRYCRQQISELLFECYGVPALCYAIDSLFNWHHNKQQSSDALILAFGHHNTHVIPILNCLPQYAGIRRINVGGYQLTSFLYRLMQLKYPTHINTLTMRRMETLMHKNCYVALDYAQELERWTDSDYYLEKVNKIQLTPTKALQRATATAANADKKQDKSKQISNLPNRSTAEGVGGFKRNLGTTNEAESNVNAKKKLLVAQPPVDISLQHWLANTHQKRDEILKRKQLRRNRRQDIAKRHTAAAQERMRIISLLAQNDKGNDNFGMNDNDWNVYKSINKEDNGSESESDNEKLTECENILNHYDDNFKTQTDDLNVSLEQSQLHVGLEVVRATELLFQPSMIGCSDAGLVETIEHILKPFSTKEQQRMVDNVFLTGGPAQITGLQERLALELKKVRPFQTTQHISISATPETGAWLGARKFANSTEFAQAAVSKQEYDECGADYFKEYFASNCYYAINKNTNNTS